MRSGFSAQFGEPGAELGDPAALGERVVLGALVEELLDPLGALPPNQLQIGEVLPGVTDGLVHVPAFRFGNIRGHFGQLEVAHLDGPMQLSFRELMVLVEVVHRDQGTVVDEAGVGGGELHGAPIDRPGFFEDRACTRVAGLRRCHTLLAQEEGEIVEPVGAGIVRGADAAQEGAGLGELARGEQVESERVDQESQAVRLGLRLQPLRGALERRSRELRGFGDAQVVAPQPAALHAQEVTPFFASAREGRRCTLRKHETFLGTVEAFLRFEHVVRATRLLPLEEERFAEVPEQQGFARCGAAHFLERGHLQIALHLAEAAHAAEEGLARGSGAEPAHRCFRRGFLQTLPIVEIEKGEPSLGVGARSRTLERARRSVGNRRHAFTRPHAFHGAVQAGEPDLAQLRRGPRVLVGVLLPGLLRMLRRCLRLPGEPLRACCSDARVALLRSEGDRRFVGRRRVRRQMAEGAAACKLAFEEGERGLRVEHPKIRVLPIRADRLVHACEGGAEAIGAHGPEIRQTRGLRLRRRGRRRRNALTSTQQRQGNRAATEEARKKAAETDRHLRHYRATGMLDPHPRTLPRTVAHLLAGGLLALLLLPGATCSTGNPGVILDPDNPGGGGGGGGGVPPKADGNPAAPVAGALYVDGAPSLLAMAPRSGATGVDVLAVIALWFRESMQPDSVTPQTLVLRPVGVGNSTAVQVGYVTTWLAGDRCVVLQPGVPLLPNTQYEVVANDELLDLDGKRLLVSTTGVLGNFRTSSQTSGLAPRVLGSFPPAGAINQPNDHPVILVFSKPMDFTGISSAVRLINLDTSGFADYDTAADVDFRHAGNRVFEFPHRSDANDLYVDVRLVVEATLTDLEFFPHPLAAGFVSTWKTLGFARPSMVVPFDADPNDPFAPAINGNNFADFEVDVTTGVSAQPSDFVTLIAHAAAAPVSRRETRLAGSGAPRFHLDLSEKGAPVFSSGSEVVLAAFVKRGPFRSTVQVPRAPGGAPATIAVDSTPPLLTSFGPPSGTFGSQFLTDAPELRPYGRATEPVGRVRVRVPVGGTAKTRDVFTPPDSGFFAGPAFTPAFVGAGPFPFDVLLTDASGNAAPAAIPASASFRGFVGPVPLISGSLRVSAYDPVTLAPVPNATVFVESFGGGAEASGLTGSDGSISFAGRSGAQTVTVIGEDRQAITVVGVVSTELSLPLAETLVPLAELSAGVTGATTGITTVSGSLLADSDGLDDADLVQSVDLEVFFGSGLLARLQRPGWFAAFHEIVDFPAAGSYFRFFALEPAVITEPSTGGNLQSPRFPLGESSNEVLAATDFQYPVSLTLGGGYDLPSDSSGAMAFARVPGLDHLAAVGAGAMAGASGEAEVEIVLHAAAVEEGATAGEVLIEAFGVDDDGDFALARSAVALAASPPAVPLVFPGIPEVLGAWTGAGHPFTRSFTATLAAGGGYYRVVIRDNAVPVNTWHVWIPATAGLGGSVTLPTLKTSPAGAVGTPPLASGPGATWRAFVEAYRMPGTFTEIGFFWTSLRRDATGFARSVVGPALAF